MTSVDELVAAASAAIEAHRPDQTFDDRWLSGLIDGPFAAGPESIEVTYLLAAEVPEHDRLDRVVAELKAAIGHADCDGYRADIAARALVCGCGFEIFRRPA